MYARPARATYPLRELRASPTHRAPWCGDVRHCTTAGATPPPSRPGPHNPSSNRDLLAGPQRLLPVHMARSRVDAAARRSSVSRERLLVGVGGPGLVAEARAVARARRTRRSVRHRPRPRPALRPTPARRGCPVWVSGPPAWAGGLGLAAPVSVSRHGLYHRNYRLCGTEILAQRLGRWVLLWYTKKHSGAPTGETIGRDDHRWVRAKPEPGARARRTTNQPPNQRRQ